MEKYNLLPEVYIKLYQQLKKKFADEYDTDLIASEKITDILNTVLIEKRYKSIIKKINSLINKEIIDAKTIKNNEYNYKKILTFLRKKLNENEKDKLNRLFLSDKRPYRYYLEAKKIQTKYSLKKHITIKKKDLFSEDIISLSMQALNYKDFYEFLCSSNLDEKIINKQFEILKYPILENCFQIKTNNFNWLSGIYKLYFTSYNNKTVYIGYVKFIIIKNKIKVEVKGEESSYKSIDNNIKISGKNILIPLISIEKKEKIVYLSLYLRKNSKNFILGNYFILTSETNDFIYNNLLLLYKIDNHIDKNIFEENIKEIDFLNIENYNNTALKEDIFWGAWLYYIFFSKKNIDFKNILEDIIYLKKHYLEKNKKIYKEFYLIFYDSYTNTRYFAKLKIIGNYFLGILNLNNKLYIGYFEDQLNYKFFRLFQDGEFNKTLIEIIFPKNIPEEFDIIIGKININNKINIINTSQVIIFDKNKHDKNNEYAYNLVVIKNNLYIEIDKQITKNLPERKYIYIFKDIIGEYFLMTPSNKINTTYDFSKLEIYEEGLVNIKVYNEEDYWGYISFYSDNIIITITQPQHFHIKIYFKYILNTKHYFLGTIGGITLNNHPFGDKIVIFKKEFILSYFNEEKSFSIDIYNDNFITLLKDNPSILNFLIGKGKFKDYSISNKTLIKLFKIYKKIKNN